ncbi:hypothetical protein MRX96_023770 [Rhipicephalus microplus]
MARWNASAGTYGRSQPNAEDRGVATEPSAMVVGERGDHTDDSGGADVLNTTTENEEGWSADERVHRGQRGAPPLPSAARSTGYGHVRSRVFPQRPAQKVQLAEPSAGSSPKKAVRAKKEALTTTAEVASNQASRLRLERIRKQREEEERLRRRTEMIAYRVTAVEATPRMHGSVQNLRRISEEESLEKAAATDGALSEQEERSVRKKYRSTSLTREVTRRTERVVREGKTTTPVR